MIFSWAGSSQNNIAMNTLIIFQFLLGFFILLVLGGVWVRYSAGQLSGRTSLLWGGVWLGAGGALIWPEFTTIAANHLGIGRGTDFVFYIGFAVVVFLLFRTQLKLEALSREITAVVRRDAVEHPKS